MRPIDSEALSEKVKHALLDVDKATCDADRQWASGYNAGLRWALGYINKAETITPPPNPPLTLEELRKMDGEPVWVVPFKGEIPIGEAPKPEYALVSVANEWICTSNTDYWEFEVYGRGILAYRRKPEEGTT